MYNTCQRLKKQKQKGAGTSTHSGYCYPSSHSPIGRSLTIDLEFRIDCVKVSAASMQSHDDTTNDKRKVVMLPW